MTDRLPDKIDNVPEEKNFSHDRMAELIMHNMTFLTYADTGENTLLRQGCWHL